MKCPSLEFGFAIDKINQLYKAIKVFWKDDSKAS